MRHHLRDLVILLAVFGGLPFQVMTDSPAYALPTSPPLRVTGGIAAGVSESSVYVGAYGAKGDGSTDDTTAIQNALNAIPSTGGTVYFPASSGCYKTQTVTPKSSTVLAGVGIGACIDIIDDGTSTGRSIYVHNVNDVTIRDLYIQSSNAVSRTGVYGNIRLDGASRVKILDCKLGKSSSVAIYAQTTTDLLIRGNYISSTFADGMNISRGSARIRIIENEITATNDDAIGLVSIYTDDGVSFYNAITDVAVTGNVIYSVGSGTAGNGINLEGVIGATVANNTINTTKLSGVVVSAVTGSVAGTATRFPARVVVEGNTIYNVGTGASSAGILVGPARQVVVKGNIIDTTTNNGVYVTPVGKDIQIIGNSISNVTGRGVYWTQTKSTDARTILELWTNLGDGSPATVGLTDGIISKNIVRQTTLDGINMIGEATLHLLNMAARDNDVYNVGASSMGVLNSLSDKASCSGNRVSGTGSGGVKVASSDQVVVSGNIVTGMTDSGLQAITSTKVAFIGNTSNSNTNYGVYIDNSGGGNNFVTGNYFASNGAAPYLIQDATSVRSGNLGDDFTGAVAVRPSTAAGGLQTGTVYQGSGAPSNSNGNNGDVYFRTDTPGTANQRVYIKSAGSWTGIL